MALAKKLLASKEKDKERESALDAMIKSKHIQVFVFNLHFLTLQLIKVEIKHRLMKLFNYIEADRIAQNKKMT